MSSNSQPCTNQGWLMAYQSVFSINPPPLYSNGYGPAECTQTVQNGQVVSAGASPADAQDILNGIIQYDKQTGNQGDAYNAQSVLNALTAYNYNQYRNTILQLQQQSSYTQNDLNTINTIVNNLENVVNGLDAEANNNNPYAGPLANYLNSLYQQAQSVQQQIQKYLNNQSSSPNSSPNSSGPGSGGGGGSSNPNSGGGGSGGGGGSSSPPGSGGGGSGSGGGSSGGSGGSGGGGGSSGPNTQQVQNYISQAENDLQSGNISGALSALQSGEQIANQIGDSQDANTISQATQILDNIQQQLNNAISTIQQEQNKSSYTPSDLQAIQNAISALNSINNSIGNNSITSYLSSYISNLASTAQQVQTNIQNYLQQEVQNYVSQAENNLQSGNISNALSALQSGDQLANQIGYTQAANTISQAIQILSSIQQQFNNAVSTIQQEQNKGQYTSSDVNTLQQIANQLQQIANQVGSNPITSYLANYLNNEANTVAQLLQTAQQQVGTNAQNLTTNLQNALQSGNLNEALQILNQLKSDTNNTAEVNQAINTINQLQNLLQDFDTAFAQGQNPQFIVNQLSALANTNNPYLNGLSTYINNIVSAFSPSNSSQAVQIEYNQTVANYLLNNDYADAIAAAPQYAPYIIALAQEPGSTFTMKMNGLLASLYDYAAKAYNALKNGDTNSAIQYKEQAKYYLNLLNALNTITGQNFTQEPMYTNAVNALNAVINVVGDAAVAVAPSVLSSSTTTQRAQTQLL
ncbi:hypothetical protein STSV2_34 [Sulfolobus virus STSV2]|uniref:hypothetical protein n=1 Tax=Sulfolobus virus STSV2 TaxID=1123964 RepID=UPI0002A804FE|nr:hypothetical protein STSV2_34 [Sulfolobus virus STSV2]AFU92013.1 hypothetical protein STSV2_34 [Sulfolobus virus STSV2]